MKARIDRGLAASLLALVFTFVCLYLRARVPWLVAFPDAWVLPVTPLLNDGMNWFVDSFGALFRGISALLDYPVVWARDVLWWLPWPATVALVAVVSHAAGGWRLVVFSVSCALYMLVTGYWDQSMNSLALVAISVPLAVAVGFGAGIAGFFSRRAERVIMPTLDLMQTVPAFAYLIPILLLFGFGTVVGLIASLFYAFPPMVRNTIVGLRGVSADVIESGLMSGATGSQLFWQVRVPSALRQILLGINQTTMASLSMVIVASIIGGTDDIGWAVLSTMRKAQFGESILAGIVIALIAMVMDRVTWGLATRDSAVVEPGDRSWLLRHRHVAAAAGLALIAIVLARLVPALHDYPSDWVYSPAALLNQAVEYVVVHYGTAIESVKTAAFFFVMLPLRIGLEQTVTPFTWGFELTATHIAVYAAAAGALAVAALRWLGAHAAVAVALLATVFYFGLTNMPWPALALLFGTLSWTVSGWRLALGTVLGVAFLLLTGVWKEAVLSLYLCGLAVAISFAFGSGLGIWAAHSDRVSALLRPVSDTLQTMPLFVLLIPMVMLFKIGEFTALLSIIAYAFVPALRYTEHGLRNLPDDVIEAARAMGCTAGQMLWQVKLPLALPVVMLGLNQTIMFGIAMLVIAALVGTNELGQRVYIGLGDGDFGIGMVAGIGMAIIAMIADRITQAWSHTRERALGMMPA